MSFIALSKKPRFGRQRFSHPFSKGLVAHWLMFEGGGITARDIATRNNGTLTSGPTWAPGKFGKAISFNGSTNYISCGPGGDWMTNTAGSMSVWFKISALLGADGAACAAGAGDSNATGGLCYFGIRRANAVGGTNTRLNMTHVVSSPASTNIVMGSTNLVANVWYHAVVTASGSAWTLYLNGVPETANVFIGSNVGRWYSQANFQSTKFNNIGSVIFTNTNQAFFPGTIDDVRIYNRVLSQQEIRQLYTSPMADVVQDTNSVISYVAAPAGTARSFAYIFG